MQQVLVRFTVDSPTYDEARDNIGAMLHFAGLGSYHVDDHEIIADVVEMPEKVEIPVWVNGEQG